MPFCGSFERLAGFADEIANLKGMRWVTGNTSPNREVSFLLSNAAANTFHGPDGYAFWLVFKDEGV